MSSPDKPSKPKASEYSECLERSLRLRADMLNHFGGSERDEPSGTAQILPSRIADQKSGGEQIARAGCVNNPFDWRRRDFLGPAVRHYHAAFFATRDHAEPNVIA